MLTPGLKRPIACMKKHVLSLRCGAGIRIQIRKVRKPEVSSAKSGKTEMGRQHTNDRLLLAIDGHRFADNAWIGMKIASPKPIAEQNDRRSTWSFLIV